MKKILATLLIIVALSPVARAYEYGNGMDAPHPNSRYWRVVGKRPSQPSTRQQQHGSSVLLLQEENELLKEQVKLFKEQIAILKKEQKRTGHSQPQYHNGLRSLEQSVSTLDRALYSVRRTRALLQGF